MKAVPNVHQNEFRALLESQKKTFMLGLGDGEVSTSGDGEGPRAVRGVGGDDVAAVVAVATATVRSGAPAKDLVVSPRKRPRSIRTCEGLKDFRESAPTSSKNRLII